MNKRKIKHNIKKVFHKISPVSVVNFSKYKKIARSRFDYSNKNLTILSPNCIAGEIYNILGLKFLSPTINSSMNRRDFLLLCENLDLYMSVEAKFKRFRGENTPVISLNPANMPEIEIAFPHDYDGQKCADNWNKRKHRIVSDNIYIICDDQNFIDGDLKRFKKLKYRHKLLFTADKRITNDEIIYIGDKEMVRRYQYKGIDGLYRFQHFFDYVDYLNKK